MTRALHITSYQYYTHGRCTQVVDESLSIASLHLECVSITETGKNYYSPVEQDLSCSRPWPSLLSQVANQQPLCVSRSTARGASPLAFSSAAAGREADGRAGYAADDQIPTRERSIASIHSFYLAS